MQHVEPMAAGCFQNAPSERLAKTAIFLAVEMAGLNPLCGVVDAGDTGAASDSDEAMMLCVTTSKNRPARPAGVRPDEQQFGPAG